MTCIKFFFGRFQIHRNDEALNQFGDFRAAQMRAEQLSGLLVEDDLDQTLILAERDGLAVADERNLPTRMSRPFALAAASVSRPMRSAVCNKCSRGPSVCPSGADAGP